MRRQPRPGIIGTDHPAPSQPGRQPPSQQRALADRYHPDTPDAATKEYVARRQGEGKNRKEIIRCLKRHIAREVYRLLTNPPPTPNCARLAPDANNANITVTQAAQQLGTHPSRISALERGRDHNHHSPADTRPGS